MGKSDGRPRLAGNAQPAEHDGDRRGIGTGDLPQIENLFARLQCGATGFEQSETTLVLLADQMPVLTFESGASTADPGVAEAAATQKVADAVVGKTAADAESAVTAAGLAYRVVSEDGSLLPVTMDYRVDRVNVVLVNGKVESASVG